MKTTRPFERLNPLNDYIFLKVMGEKGDEVQLLGFLNAVLGRTGNDRLASVEIIENKTLSAEFIGGKTSVLDVRAMLQDGSRVNIEVQLRNRGNFDRRSLFYWSREYAKGIKAGHKYVDLPSVITINIIDFDFLETENFHTVFHLREDKENHIVLTDVLEIHFLNMVKWRRLGKKDIANNPLHRWLTWQDRSSPPELITEVTSMDNAIKTAEDRLAYLSEDEETIHAYEMRELALIDWNSSIIHARREGKEEGINEGKEEKQIEIARNALAEGATPEFVRKITGLDPQVIEKLK